MLKKNFVLVFTIVIFVLNSGYAQVWNNSDDWHCDSSYNPDNDWAYGYMPAGGGSFVLHNWATCSTPPDYPDYSYWTTDAPWGKGGYTHKNMNPTDPFLAFGAYWEPSETTAWPMNASDDLPTFRWIAPATGTYLVNAEFTGNAIGGTTTDVIVGLNETPVFAENIDGYRGDDTNPAFGTYRQTYGSVLLLTAGDTLDFSVGRWLNDADHDCTGVHVTIAEVPVPVLWLKADAGVVFDAFGISAWQDQSGNGNDAATEYGTPLLATATFPAGNFAVVRLDGDDSFGLANDAALQTSTVNAFIVASVDAASQNQTVMACASAGGSGYSVGISGTTANKPVFNTNTGGALEASVEMTADEPYVISAILDGGTSEKKLKINRMERASGTGSVSYTSAAATVGALDGGSKFLTGDIAEIMIFDVQLSDDQLKAVESYLANKYGIKECGDPDTQYLSADVNQDCHVNLKDFSFVSQNWLNCNDPASTECSQ